MILKLWLKQHDKTKISQPEQLKEVVEIWVEAGVKKLEDLDDVRKVDTNLNLREEIIEAFATA